MNNIFDIFHPIALPNRVQHFEPVSPQMSLDFLWRKHIRIMQTHIVNIFVFLSQSTHHIQYPIEIALLGHILTYHFVTLFAVPLAGRIFLPVDPAGYQHSGIRLRNSLIFTHNAADVLDDFHIRRLRVDEHAHIGVFGVDAFANRLAGGNHIDVVIGRLIEGLQQGRAFFRRDGRGEGDHVNVMRHCFVGEFGCQYGSKGGTKGDLIDELQDGRVAVSIDIGVEGEHAAISTGENSTGNGLIQRPIGVFQEEVNADFKRVQIVFLHTAIIRIVIGQRATLVQGGVALAVIHDDIVCVFRGSG